MIIYFFIFKFYLFFYF